MKLFMDKSVIRVLFYGDAWGYILNTDNRFLNARFTGVQDLLGGRIK